jgi:hypothetical protein
MPLAKNPKVPKPNTPYATKRPIFGTSFFSSHREQHIPLIKTDPQGSHLIPRTQFVEMFLATFVLHPS